MGHGQLHLPVMLCVEGELPKSDLAQHWQLPMRE